MVVRDILSLFVLAGGLAHPADALCREPWEVEMPPPLASAQSTNLIIDGGVWASVLFASFGIGYGAGAASLDTESARIRNEPCRSCPGGFNEMQRDMASFANASILAFAASGVAGVGTALYAINVERKKAEKKENRGARAVVRFQGGLLGVQVLF